jgi:tRNA pseudouridine55 synthase
VTGGGRSPAPRSASGLVIVDKPAGWTSHDVVARLRRLAATPRVGHAGTLDPMATGVLVVGVERATRLLHHLVLTDKAYTATIRLGASTTTDDAEGEVVSAASPAQVTETAVREAMRALTGAIRQVPSSVSAIKVAGRRAYTRTRAGEDVILPARPVTVSHFQLLAVSRTADHLDLDVEVECSSGTYVRALARDLGIALGVGGHLTVLRRTRVGPFPVALARTLRELDALADPITVPLDQAVRTAFPIRELTPPEACDVCRGRPIAASGRLGPTGAFTSGGTAVAILRDDGGRARPVLVFTPAG